MKQIPLLRIAMAFFVIVLLSNNALSQFVSFEDPKLEAFMVRSARTIVNGDSQRIDANENGRIEISEAESLVNLSFYPIDFISGPGTNITTDWATSIGGIEYFKNLEELIINCPAKVGYTDLTSLTKLEKLVIDDGNPACSGASGDFIVDLTGLTNLKEIVSENFVKNIILDGCDNLEKFHFQAAWAFGEPIFEGPLDISNNLNITDLSVTGILEEIIFGNNTNLERFSTSARIDKLDFRGLDNLKYIEIREPKEIIVQDLPNLDSLIVTNSDLVGDHIFSNLPKLTFLNISGFTNSTDIQSVWSLENMPNIEKIRMQSDGSLFRMVGEFPNLTSIDLRSFILEDQDEITDYQTLQTLNLTHCSIDDIALQNLPVLTNLSLENNDISEIDLSNLNSLETLRLSANPISILDVHSLESLTQLYLTNAETLIEVNLSDLPSLEDFNVTRSSITELRLNQIPSLKTVNASDCQLTLFEGDDLPNLRRCGLGENFLTDISLTNSANLEVFDISNNQITNFDFNNYKKIQTIEIEGNLFTEFLVQDLPDMAVVGLQNNLINDVQITNCPSLVYFFANHNHIESLDLSQSLGVVQQISIFNNPISYLNLKDNGKLFVFNTVNDSLYIPNDFRVCADEIDLDRILPKLEASEIEDYSVSSFCPLNNEEAFFALVGSVKVDVDDDGCNETDIPVANTKFFLEGEGANGYYLSDSQGHFRMNFPEGEYNVNIETDVNNYFEVSPQNIALQFPTDGIVVNQDFCFEKTEQDFDDLKVFIASDGVFRPGFNEEITITYKNAGNTILPATITLNAASDFGNFVSSSVDLDFVNGDYQIDLGELLPFEEGSIQVIYNLNPPTDPVNPLNDGDNICFQANITIHDNEVTEGNNSHRMCALVVNSYDPNDKTCLDGDYIDPEMIGDFVNYRVRFENTGTAEAVNIVVRDTIDTQKFDIATLEIVHASHEMYTVIKDENIVEFIFERIYLPFEDETNDGYVIFKIKTWPDLQEDDVIINSAGIFFDFNFPIITNTSESIFKLVVDEDMDGYNNLEDCNDLDASVNPASEEIANNGIDEDCDGVDLISSTYNFPNSQVSFYPNPVINEIFIKVEGQLYYDIELIDVQGKLIFLASDLKEVDVSAYANGIYLLSLTDRMTGNKIVEKIVVSH